MANPFRGDSESWFTDHEVLVAELKQGEFAPRCAPTLDGFDDLHEIGRGGQAVVYAGIQRSTKRRVAVKVLLDGTFASQMSRRRFEREVELVASLRHPNIVGIHDSGCSADGHPFCVMELIDGVPLDEYIAHLKATVAPARAQSECVELLAAICDAVNYAHQRGVIHRDLKPSNIRIDKEGKPHILDFGLAKLCGRTSEKASASGVSLTGQFVGSMTWASPEQVRGEPDLIDIRSDVYSLGVILYYAVSGRFPYEVSGPLSAVIDRILTAAPHKPRLANPHINEDLETIILRCLAKEPDRRYQTAGELAGDLRRYLAGEPVLARGDSAWYAIRRSLKRYRTTVFIVAIAFASAVVLSIVMTVLYSRAVRAEASARQEAARASAVNSFLSDMLASADPEAKGRDVTVRALLKEAGRELNTGLASEPVVQASLHSIMATTFRGLGDYAEARGHWDAAISMYRRLNGENDRHTIEAERELGDLFVDQSKPEEAEKIIVASRARAQAGFQPDDPVVMRADGSLARLRSHQGRWHEAEGLFNPLIERMSRVLGADHKETLATTNNLAAVCHSQGKYAEAEAMYRRVLAAQTACRGKDSPAALTSMANIAVVLNSLGKLAEAETMLREEIAGALRVWGPEHQATLASQANLVFNLRQQGRQKEALELALAVLPIQKRVLGPEHANTIGLMNTLAAIYEDLNQLDAALPMALEAFEISRRVYGDDNEDTLTAMHNYGGVLLRAGRLAEAEAIFVRNLELCRKLYPPDHPDMAWPMNELASVWVKQGKTDPAANLFADAIGIVRKGLPPDHYFLPWLLYNRGSCLRDAKHFEDAEKDLLECYELYRNKSGNAHSDTQSVIRALLKLYRTWERPADAAGYEMLLNPPPTSQPTTSPNAAAFSGLAPTGLVNHRHQVLSIC